jgi:hypothetical protein
MRSLLLSSIIIGLLSVIAVPAIAGDVWQSHNQTTTAAYLTNATDQATIVPVVRHYSYYGGPGWYGYRSYPRYGAYYSPYYYSNPYPYQTYVYPGPNYGYGYYPPSDFYYTGRRGRLGFVY